MPPNDATPRGCTKDPEQVISEMCGIRGDVARHLGWKHSADCICADRRGVAHFRDDGPVTEFIRAAVAEKIAREKPAPGPSWATELASVRTAPGVDWVTQFTPERITRWLESHWTSTTRAPKARTKI